MLPKFKKKITMLDVEIIALESKLESLRDKPEEYKETLRIIERLYALKKDSKDKVSKDALLGLIGSLASIGMIMGYERGHILTTKALGHIFKKGRV